MATPIEIDNKIRQEEQKIEGRFVPVGIWSLVIFIIITCVLALFYLWEYPKFELDYPIDAERWGQFGDFFGGFLGTIITFASIVFLYQAFKEQHLANISTQSVNLEIINQNSLIKEQDKQHLYWEFVQQFDSKFNTLLSLYQESLLGYKSNDSETGKAGLITKVSSFIASTPFYTSDKYTKRVTSAHMRFDVFITKHRTLVNAHMRLLYQLFNLLENTQIHEEDKIVYAKILRSQLTDEELILIRYNCISRRGKNMQLPIFQYNILKHLPLMDLFEFKKYRSGLSIPQINYLNDTFVFWRKQICSLFQQESTNEKHLQSIEYGNRYKLLISVSNDNRAYKFVLKKRPKTPGRNYELLVSILDKYSDVDLETLLLDFHTEIFRHSHFRNYNRERTFRINHECTTDTDSTFSIKIINENPIIVSYSQIQNPTFIN